MNEDIKKVTIDDLLAKKERKEKITRVVLWDYPMACLADASGVDMILVGDSVGMCMLGYPNTLPVTMDEMVHHCKAVVRGARRCMVVGDLPFMSYEIDVREAVRNAGRLVKEAGVDAVKIEGGAGIAKTAEAIAASGIPVHGHIGLTPQRVKQLGGFKTQGKTIRSAVTLFSDALSLAEAGCFAVTLECVPPVLGRLMSEKIPSLIVISAGAGPWCDGQSVNLYDLIGLTRGKTPRFTKAYADVGNMVKAGIEQYCRETKDGVFPGEAQCYNIDDDMAGKIAEAIESLPE